MRREAFVHEFTEYVPRDPDNGVIYVSIRFRTVVHKCACGCGTKIATPLSPASWTLTYDGDAISLSPSVGGWGLPCRSHYWITSNQVRWSGQWTDARIAAGRARDDQERRHYFEQRAGTSGTGTQPRQGRPRARWLRRLSRRQG